jgi:hypothetical protein
LLCALKICYKRELHLNYLQKHIENHIFIEAPETFRPEHPKNCQPFFLKSAKNSAPNFHGPTQFFSAPFAVGGRNFGPLVTLPLSILNFFLSRYQIACKHARAEVGAEPKLHKDDTVPATFPFGILREYFH